MPAHRAGPAAALALVLLLPALAAPAAAFRSVSRDGKPAPHTAITGVAEQLGWPEDAVEALQEAVARPDVIDFEPVEVEDGPDRLDATAAFQPSHHCDRVPPASDAQAFNATVAYVAYERGLAANLSLVDPAAAVRALGRALHALQDCYAHTNVVDLPAPAQGQVRAALLAGRGSPPAGLRLAGSRPGIAQIGDPPGDPWPHDAHNRDAPGSSPDADAVLADGRTRHEVAAALAAGTTQEFLAAFAAGLDPAERESILGVDDDAGAGPTTPPRGLPLPPSVLLAFLLLALALRRRA